MEDLVDRVTRKNQDLVSELPLTISAQYGLIDQNEFFDKRVASKDVSGYYLIENGEFAYNKSTSTDAPWGAVKRLDRYENGVLSTLYIVFGIKKNNPVDSDFLVSYYSTNLWHKGIHEIAAEGARNHGLLNIAPADFFETELTIPQDIEEQKKIGKYFEELERLITLHQCKCRVLPKLLYNDWEQRKLGEIAIEILAGGDIDKEKVVDDGTYPIYANALTNDGIVGYYNDYYRVKAPAVTVTGRGEVGHAQARMTDFTPVVRLLAIRSNHDCYFLENAINNQNVVVESTGVPQLTVPQLSSYDICFPKDIREEEKIGAYYKKLDNLITLHQRKCEETKKLKKYMLQKMFPQNGQTVPEIRFAGFTDAWEQRKLGDICSRVQGNDGRMELPTLTISAGNGWMNQEDRFSGNIAGKEQKNYTLLKRGELSYNHGNSKLAKYGTVFSLQTYEEALVPRVYHSFKVEKGNANFVEYYFATKLPDRELGKLISSGARMDGLLNIGYDDFMGISLLLPKTQEQDCIAGYFRKIDMFITLHHRKYIYILKSP